MDDEGNDTRTEPRASSRKPRRVRRWAFHAAKRAGLDRVTTELMGNFGAHSRNMVRGVLKASATP